jgi:hypothetical protein
MATLADAGHRAAAAVEAEMKGGNRSVGGAALS